MKTIKIIIVSAVVAASAVGCNSRKAENAKLQHKVDSLSTALQENQQVTEQMKEVNGLIDSIDVSRKLLRVNVVEGTSYANYSNRLKDINQYIKDTQEKITELEKTAKNARGLSSSIRRMKADLELRTQEIAALQMEVSKMRSENESMLVAISKKDSSLLAREDVIKVRESDIASLEARMRDTDEKNKSTVAILYYNQGKALEKVAAKTNFAPRKKKEALGEALEMYKISLSLGNTEAQDRINAIASN